MSIYSEQELQRLAGLEARIENAKYWLRYWKGSHVIRMMEHWNNELLALLKEYNALLDKQPVNQP